MHKRAISHWLLGLTIFAGLLPLSFYYDGADVHFLIDSSLNWLVWSALFVGLAVLLFFGGRFNNRQLFAIGVLYACVPFAFYFVKGAVTFIILHRHVDIAACYWIIAVIALTMSFRRREIPAAN